MDIVTGVGVLDKAMIVLGAIEAGPRSLGELQSATGLPRATAHRLATALEAHGLLRRDDDGRFELGPHLVTLGRAASGRFALDRGGDARCCDELRDTTGESVQLFVREGDARRCVISLESPHGLRWIVPEGSLLPLDLGSSGRVLLGETTRSGLGRERRRTRAGRGLGQRPDRRCVRRRGRGHLAVSGPIERLSRTPGKRFGRAVADAAQRIAP